MRYSRRIAQLILGVALVVHGLGNAVLPLRGIDEAGQGAWPIAAAVLYIVAIIGFVKAGLGILGVRPLRRGVLMDSCVASLCALVGQWWLGHPDLKIGIALDVILPLLTAAYVSVRPLSAPTSRHPYARLAADMIGVAFLAWITATAVLWPWARAWGSTPREWTMTLPGDQTPRTPAFELLHAVTIDAPPSAVWPWVVQLGQDRAGFYSYDWLERLFGVDVHNVAEIRPEWQARQAGDRVYATQADYLGGVFAERPGWNVVRVDPNEALVLEQWGAFVLVPDGHGRTRFLIRSTISNERIPVWAAALNFSAFELPHFIMQRRMMLSVKALAEHANSSASARRNSARTTMISKSGLTTGHDVAAKTAS